MQRSRFVPSFDELPATLPVFPLESVIVLPGADLPLNIFEPRYLNMVEDVLKSHHMFGMVQPNTFQTGSQPQVCIIPAAPGGSPPTAKPATTGSCCR